ncbi:MAG TPA: bifunctional DNA-binding transcriptional regulator/O6-methylguanine-DNA methyltransferase Ada [Thermoanaerobaculia bacterium]
MTRISDDAAWEAVLKRDRRFDGAFVFAVTSTGIYCRPSCPARRPRRANVRFFAARDEAEQQGFRRCKRCGAEGTPLTQRVKVILDQRVEEGVTLKELARATNSSPHHLQRVFKRELGVSPKEYLAARRAERLKETLKGGSTVTDAIYESGYGSSSRLYAQTNARLGMTPKVYRDGGRGMHIHYTTVDTVLGRMLVALTERGVCAVSLGDDDDTLQEALEREYPNAHLEQTTDPALTNAVNAIVAQLEGRASAIDLPLDVQATSFQLRVWNALRQIPYGETRTYAEIAAAIGKPEAVRAVANACARNRVALVVPCHRVVRTDGARGGYRWGAARKETLLAKEAPKK